MIERFIRKTVDIDSPVETVWKILTDNAFIPQYMFGCNAETDWKPGSPLLWKGAADGKLYVKGNIVSVDAPHHLAYTVIDPNSTIADIPENYLTMTYTLKQRGVDASVLEIAQGDFTTVASSDTTIQSVAMILSWWLSRRSPRRRPCSTRRRVRPRYG